LITTAHNNIQIYLWSPITSQELDPLFYLSLRQSGPYRIGNRLFKGTANIFGGTCFFPLTLADVGIKKLFDGNK
jgi:hypothetical protein